MCKCKPPEKLYYIKDNNILINILIKSVTMKNAKINYDKTSKDSIYNYAKSFLNKNLTEILDDTSIKKINKEISKYKGKRKGHLGDLVEEYLFDIKNNSDANADFKEVGIELKTTPLKQLKSKKYSPKERLVFSMIDYMSIIDETWESSSFLKKNKLLLIMFYLYEEDKSILEYDFKLIELLNLLEEVSKADIAQIKLDWEKIVTKIREGNAHLLSEGDTLYLGAAPKAANSKVRRQQPNNTISAKPRAFSLKTTYLNYLIQNFLGKDSSEYSSLIDSKKLPLTIEENVKERFSSYIGKTHLELEKMFNIKYEKRPKNYRRLLINKLLGATSNKIEEFEKANVTLRVLALEPSSRLTESISFPIFKYTEIVNETWEESSFYEQLSQKKFLFVVFKKSKEGIDIFEQIKFWNFPMKDIDKAKWVWEETVKRILNKKADYLPSLKENTVAHVRPHGRTGEDKIDTGYGTKEVKKCFWLNAKYIEKELKGKSEI